MSKRGSIGSDTYLTEVVVEDTESKVIDLALKLSARARRVDTKEDFYALADIMGELREFVKKEMELLRETLLSAKWRQEVDELRKRTEGRTTNKKTPVASVVDTVIKEIERLQSRYQESEGFISELDLLQRALSVWAPVHEAVTGALGSRDALNEIRQACEDLAVRLGGVPGREGEAP